MRLARQFPLALCLLAGSLLALTPRTARAQAAGAAPEAVTILTVDHVELQGHFYPSNKGKTAPTVMLLHALDEDCKKAEWISLAKALQAKGYAVLRFDFRGYGDSTTIKQPGKLDPVLPVKGFWDEVPNKTLIRNPGLLKGERKTTLDAKDFMPGYLPTLANDIAAAKAFLDERNDNGECNSANLILIGAKEGATLGALWLNSEFQRYRLLPPRGTPDLGNPEGGAVSACVWLSASSTLGKAVNVSVPYMLLKAGADNKVPMVFFYGPEDKKAAATASACEKILKRTPKDYPLTMKAAVPKAEKLAGSELLLKSLKTEPTILDYLQKALDTKTPPWKTRVQPMDIYVWVYQANGAGPVRQGLARPARATSVVFNTYRAFLRYGQ
jgi:pimeloyl-ACP methyl ester carboxylesterase